MKILYFCSSHKIGLTGQLTQQIITFSRDPKARFLALSGEKEQFPGLFLKLRSAQVDHVTIRGLDDHSGFIELTRKLIRIINIFQPDNVTVHTNWQLAMSVVARVIVRKQFKILYTINGYRHNHKYRAIIAKALIGSALFFFADDVVAPCSFLRKKFFFLGRKIKLIFIGEDDILFGSHALPDFGGTKRLVFPGEFRSGKNQDMLIRALKRYIDLSGDNNVELFLPGKGVKLDSCKALCRELGMSDKVQFPGFLDRGEMLDLYLSCQYALVSSNIETFGHCIVEPYILGRVVISRHVGVAEDIIRHGESGFFYDNEHELVEVLLQAFKDRTLCTRVSVEARKNRDLFRWERICKQHFDLVYDPKNL